MKQIKIKEFKKLTGYTETNTTDREFLLALLISKEIEINGKKIKN